jgi:hypothetical protein
VNEPEPVASDQRELTRPVFISYASANRKEALSVCKAIERRGATCWISCRDVEAGENYQESIVRALRNSRAMVLVFSDAANNSDEIKKELSLASRYHVPVMALRIEDVEPSDAFAYELSTRQWLDAFDGWDRSIDSLVRRIGEMRSSQSSSSASPSRAPAPRRSAYRRPIVATAAVLLLLVVISGGLWWFFRPVPAAAHSMMVRLTGFQRLSTDLPATMPDAIRDEIIAAFGDQGEVGVSTASAPAPGSAPAYALGGTVRRDGDQIRVITHLTNERSGATLWSDSFNYAAGETDRLPRRVAVRAGNMVRCGLFAASTYPKPLPDAVLTDYMQYCGTAAVFQTEPGKALDFAQRVVAAAPRFSWGWSAVALAAVQDMFANPSGPAREELRKEGLQAADKAIALDSSNSEALAQKSLLLDPRDWVGQEALLKRAVAARPLACGCEHVYYGLMLENVGRYADSVDQFRRATDMLALDGNSQFTLGDSLMVVGKKDEAKPHMDAAIDLFADPAFADFVAMIEAPETGDYRGAIKAMHDPKLQLTAAQRTALLSAFEAMASGDPAKAQAAQMLLALPRDRPDILVTKMVAKLGATHQALQLFANGLGSRSDWPSIVWYPSMRGVLNDPGFPALTQKLGMMAYWKASHTKPDVCSAKDPPAFCRMI